MVEGVDAVVVVEDATSPIGMLRRSRRTAGGRIALSTGHGAMTLMTKIPKTKMTRKIKRAARMHPQRPDHLPRDEPRQHPATTTKRTTAIPTRSTAAAMLSP